MSAQKVHNKTGELVKWLQRFAGRQWYPPLIALLAALDNFVVVIPNDGILISSSILIPKRWFLFALSMAVGSTIGAMALAVLVEYQGLPWILEIYPGLTQSQTWILAAEFFEKYGLLLVFFVAVTPIAQQPAVILAALAEAPVVELAAVVFCGRLIKFLIMAYVGSHAPRFLPKMWGLGRELREAGVDELIVGKHDALRPGKHPNQS